MRIIIGKERESYEPEFNYRIRGRTLRTESLDRSNAKDLAQVVRILREVDVSPVSLSSTTGCEQSRSEMDRWKILHSAKDLKQKRRNVKRSADVSGNARDFCED